MYRDTSGPPSLRSTSRPIVRACAALMLAMTPAAASAQTPSPPPVAGWQNGFFVQSANGDHRLTLGTVVQFDGRFTTDDPPAIVDTFTIRKARIIMGGRVAKYFEFRVMPDFGAGSPTLLDAYFDVRFSPTFRVRMGKDKAPVGYEVLIGDAALLFPERAQASGLLPGRDVGVQVQGDVSAARLTYAAGIFNGVLDGTNSTADVDNNAGKDLAGRVTVQPFKSARTPDSPLGGLGFHVGGSTGKQNGSLPFYRTSVFQTYYTYAPAANGLPAAIADGRRTRVTPAVFYYQKSFGAFAEYTRTTQAVSRGGPAQDLTHDAWQVTGSYLLTGESASSGLPSPNAPFDPAAHKWGALQVVARYADFTIDDRAFDAGFAATGASRRAQQTTVGLNWYPTTFVKYYLNVERIVFDSNAPGARPAEHTIAFRCQLAF